MRQWLRELSPTPYGVEEYIQILSMMPELHATFIEPDVSHTLQDYFRRIRVAMEKTPSSETEFSETEDEELDQCEKEHLS